MPTVFIPREIVSGETRVSATPETVKRMVKAGFTVTVQAGAGSGSFIHDDAYTGAGAAIAAEAAAGYAAADMVTKLHPPQLDEATGKHEADLLKEGSLLISFLWPFANLDTVKRLAARKVSAFAMDLVPRITRAQSMDALSSQSNIAGYKAVILAADHAAKLFPLLMTAAGTITPARVVVLGAGVAGLQALATAKRLGAVVEVSDIRTAVKEQVESLGGKFIDVGSSEDMQDAGGYAKEVSAEFLRKQQEVVRQHMTAADVVITTALVPGKPAPKLIPAETVKAMKAGSVIVDLAVEQGGNCELSEPGKVVVKHGVTIVGQLNLPATLPAHASDMYARNVLYVFQDLVKEGQIKLNLEDEIVTGALVTHAGEVRNQAVAERLKGGSRS